MSKYAPTWKRVKILVMLDVIIAADLSFGTKILAALCSAVALPYGVYTLFKLPPCPNPFRNTWKR